MTQQEVNHLPQPAKLLHPQQCLTREKLPSDSLFRKVVGRYILQEKTEIHCQGWKVSLHTVWLRLELGALPTPAVPRMRWGSLLHAALGADKAT